MRELRQQRLVGRRHLAVAQGNSVKQRDYALGYGPEFVAAFRRKSDPLRVRPPSFIAHLIVALIILLEHETPVPRDDDAMDVAGPPGQHELIESRVKVWREPRLGRRRRLRCKRRSCARRGGASGQHGSANQQPAAIEHRNCLPWNQ